MADCVGDYSYIRLVLPVFHIGYFKMVIAMLQGICKVRKHLYAKCQTHVICWQTCSRVLLDEEQRRHFLKLFRKPHLENVQRTALAKRVNTACRKVTLCPYCGSLNGTIKKVGALKIIHEKYRGKKLANQRLEFEETFKHAASEMREIAPHIHKAQEDMNPLKALNLFKQITAVDCELLGLDPAVGRPEEFIWQYLSVPPVCIRPSVAQEAATYVKLPYQASSADVKLQKRRRSYHQAY